MTTAEQATKPSAPAGARKAATFSHRVEYLATRVAAAALKGLGWRAASTVGGTIARLAYRPLGIRRGVTERQIAAALPALSSREVETIARASYESLGRTSIETATLPGASREEVLARFEPAVGWELLQRAIDARRGVILVTGHLGNWELGGAYVAARGVPIDVVARGMANPLFDAYLNRTRLAIGMEVIHDSEAVRRTPRSLKQGRAVAMVCDQDALGLASTFVPFFGRPAKTPRGPAVFALRLDVPVLFVAVVRERSGRYRMHISAVPVLDTGNRDADVDAIVLAFTQRLEEFVRRFPEQYFWQHRRWRRQPPDTPAHLREP